MMPPASTQDSVERRARSGVCIGLPVHNGGRFLPEALDCLLGQTCRDFHVIALDDGSTDGSGDVLRRYAERETRLHCHFSPVRSGLIGAWRRTAELARELFDPEFFAWYSDHDRVAPDWLEKLLAALREDPGLACVYARTDRISSNGAVTAVMENGYDSSGLGVYKRIKAASTRKMGAGDIVYGLFRFSVVKRCGLFRDELMPDRLLVAESQIFGGIRPVPEALRWRRMTHTSTSTPDTVAHQLRTLFADGTSKTCPAWSHVTCFLRESMATALASDPESQFRRMLLGWMYLAGNARKFRDMILREAAEGGSLAGADFLRESLLDGKGLPEMLRTDAARETSEEKLALQGKYGSVNRWGAASLLARKAMPLLKHRANRRQIRTQMTCPRILHIVPDSISKQPLHFHGSTKDIRGRTEYFRARGLPFAEVEVERVEKPMLEKLHAMELESFGCIILDIPGSFPGILRYIRMRAPSAILLFRSLNAEMYHRLDWMLASRGAQKKLRCFGQAVAMLLRDLQTLMYVDRVLPICDWDGEHYWRHLGHAPKVVSVPYFLPTEYIRGPQGTPDKEYLCVCLGSVAGGALTEDSIRRFSCAVRSLGDRLPQWRFSMTGLVEEPHTLPPRVEVTGLLGSPFEALRKARAVAVLSDYGRGFKTKILDAIEAGAWVIVSRGLHRRLPPEVLPLCIPVRRGSTEDLVEALERCTTAPPDLPINNSLRDRAFAAMDRVLGLVDLEAHVQAHGGPSQQSGLA